MANTGKEGKHNNIVYVFVPFRFDDIEGVMSAAKRRCREGDAVWEDGSKDVRSYFFKYLTDKISVVGDGGLDCRCCIHLSAKERNLSRDRMRPGDEWNKILSAQKGLLGFSMGDVFWLRQPSYMDDTRQKIDFRFHIDSLKLTVFRTGIGLVSFGLVFEGVDPIEMGAAEFLLKLSIEKLDRTSDYGMRNSIVQMDGAERTDFATVARGVLESTIGLGNAQFNFYSKKPRGNLFSVFIAGEQDDGKDFEKELYYLGNGYGVSFMYPGDNKDAVCQLLGAPNVRWCVSNEVACCLVRPGMHPPAEGFIYGSFYYKFRCEYLFMYIWLLHQKYALYAFLTDISANGLSVASREKADALRNYKRRFTDFEANYVFARVTEVPQYQQLYDAVSKQFALQTMYDDVKEPLSALEALAKDDEVRAREEERRTADGITKILATLGVLGIASALVDGYDFIGKFFGCENSGLAHWVQVCQYACTGAILLFVGWVVMKWLRWIGVGKHKNGNLNSKEEKRK